MAAARGASPIRKRTRMSTPRSLKRQPRSSTVRHAERASPGCPRSSTRSGYWSTLRYHPGTVLRVGSEALSGLSCNHPRSVSGTPVGASPVRRWRGHHGPRFPGPATGTDAAHGRGSVQHERTADFRSDALEMDVAGASCDRPDPDRPGDVCGRDINPRQPWLELLGKPA